MVDQKANAGRLRDLWNAVNEAGPQAMRKWLVPDYVRHGSDRDYNRDQWIEVMLERSRAFPDNKSVIQDIVCEGNRVAYRWTAEGTHQHVYMRIPATGRRVVAQGVTIAIFEGGLIREEWASWNKISVLHSLGILPIT